MTCLHISIEQIKGKTFRISCNNLRREDANEAEISHANLIEKLIGNCVIPIISEKILSKETIKSDMMDAPKGES